MQYSQLPDEVDEPQVVKSDSDADPVMRLAVYSDRMTPSEVTDYLERFIVDRITTIDGVANVRVYGERRAAIRIWLDRGRLAAHNLTVADVEAALRRNNLELPAGEVKSEDRQLTVRLNSRLSSVEDFRDVVLDRDEAPSHGLRMPRRRVVGVQVVGDGPRLDAKQVLVEGDGPLIVLQRLQVLHVADVLRDKGVLVAGQAKGVLDLGPASENLARLGRRGAGRRGRTGISCDRPSGRPRRC